MSNPLDGLLTKEQTDLVFDNMSDGVIMVNEDGIITYINSACAKIFHISAETAIQRSFAEIFLQNKRKEVRQWVLIISTEEEQNSLHSIKCRRC